MVPHADCCRAALNDWTGTHAHGQAARQTSPLAEDSSERSLLKFAATGIVEGEQVPPEVAAANSAGEGTDTDDPLTGNLLAAADSAGPPYSTVHQLY